MDLIQQPADEASIAAYASPPCVARFRPIFWEPVGGTGERIVALIAVESHEASTEMLSAATYSVIPVERLRAMLGRQRGSSAHGVLREAAEYMTKRQVAGLPIVEVEAPFHGFVAGPTLVARGFSVEQLLDAAVRSVSAFGVADDLVEDEVIKEPPRHTIKTAEFLKSLKRRVAGDDEAIRARFEQRVRPHQNLPDLVIDYAFAAWMLQVTSLPATAKQAANTLRESQSKLLELDLMRREMGPNNIKPVLLVNEDVLSHGTNQASLDEAEKMKARLTQLTSSLRVEMMGAPTPDVAAEQVFALQ